MRAGELKTVEALKVFCLAGGLVFALVDTGMAQQSAARQWDEEALNAVRHDLARPPIQARNLFHVSVAMYDAWAVYDPIATRYLTQESITAADPETARAESISYAAYRVLRVRYANSPGAVATMASLDARMAALGYDINVTTTAGNSPAAVGNRVAANVLAYGLADGSNEQGDYAPIPSYQPVNPPLIVALPGSAVGVLGNPGLVDPNRWQPLALSYFVDQNGNPIPTGYPSFICPHWGHVAPFALTPADMGPPFVYHDAGPPPLYGGVGDAEYKSTFADVVKFSSMLTPDDPTTIDISPGARGNNTLGTNDGHGRPLNPVTGQPYAPNVVNRGDFGRVLAEFWADGPSSETPPGHWNVIANFVADYPGFQRRFGGIGPILNNLEWDVKVYLAINGAMHDAAITAWGAKGYYDSIRPISAIRHMCDLGQCSDIGEASYHPGGIPLQPGVIEVITAQSSAPGERHAALANFVGEIAVLAWPGPPANPMTEHSGVRWIRAKNWIPYQKATFVTPPFAGYISGHSTYSRAGAEVMTRLTGTEYFPGGMGEFLAPANHFLAFEQGPSADVMMQWATYYDAADEAGLSRLWGGIHPRADDFPGRTRGALVGIAAFEKAADMYVGASPCVVAGDVNGDGIVDGLDIAGFLRASQGYPPVAGENRRCADFGAGSAAGNLAAFVARLLQ